MINIQKQKGAVLFFVLITLPMLVVLGLMLVENSSVDLKMVDARVVRNESNIKLTAAAADMFASIKSPASFALATTGAEFSSARFSDAVGTVTVKDDTAPVKYETGKTCKRSKNASGNDFQCLYLEVKFVHKFGRERADETHWGSNAMGVGVEQPYIAH
ncbi:hypothetical protein [Psychromonas aquimarina]|uniref:hypothetical protein n=1 Tax=Psychromonas aquimarina TaxID=444919 RepID=UPI0003FBB2B6|nr:hypothetical protein [Psychromonas aquimarina]